GRVSDDTCNSAAAARRSAFGTPPRAAPLLDAAAGTRDRGDDRNAEIAEHAESFSRTSERALRPRRARRFESRLGVLRSLTLQRGREIAETIETPRAPRTRSVLRRRPARSET